MYLGILVENDTLISARTVKIYKISRPNTWPRWYFAQSKIVQEGVRTTIALQPSHTSLDEGGRRKHVIEVMQETVKTFLNYASELQRKVAEKEKMAHNAWRTPGPVVSCGISMMPGTSGDVFLEIRILDSLRENSSRFCKGNRHSSVQTPVHVYWLDSIATKQCPVKERLFQYINKYESYEQGKL